MKRTLSHLALISLISLVSCDKDEIIRTYTFSAYIESGLLHIDYHSQTTKGCVIWISPDPDHIGHDTQKITSDNFGCDKTTSLYWSTTYVTLENYAGTEQIIIK